MKLSPGVNFLEVHNYIFQNFLFDIQIVINIVEKIALSKILARCGCFAGFYCSPEKMSV